MIIRFSAIALGAALLAGCASSEDTAPQEPVPTPYMTPPVSQDGALQQREPDTCGAKTYVSALGQPASVIPTLGITGHATNVVEWRGIEPQIYDPMRIVFRLDQNGNIYNIDCG